MQGTLRVVALILIYFSTWTLWPVGAALISIMLSSLMGPGVYRWGTSQHLPGSCLAPSWQLPGTFLAPPWHLPDNSKLSIFLVVSASLHASAHLPAPLPTCLPRASPAHCAPCPWGILGFYNP